MKPLRSGDRAGLDSLLLNLSISWVVRAGGIYVSENDAQSESALEWDNN